MSFLINVIAPGPSCKRLQSSWSILGLVYVCFMYVPSDPRPCLQSSSVTLSCIWFSLHHLTILPTTACTHPHHPFSYSKIWQSTENFSRCQDAMQYFKSVVRAEEGGRQVSPLQPLLTTMCNTVLQVHCGLPVMLFTTQDRRGHLHALLSASHLVKLDEFFK